ncbi:MAG: alpha/beta fold hydrolase, partial [Dehalococcoidia bacterium]
MEQEIHFCTTPDGVRIAYAVVGSGPAVIRVPPWISHLEVQWQLPGYRQFIERLAQNFTVVTIDKRGNGLSDRGVGDFSPEARLSDLETVVDHLKLRSFALDGYSEGGPTSIMFAAKYPKRVTRMVLTGTFARGDTLMGTPELRSATMALVAAEWGVATSMLTDLFMGNNVPSEARMFFAHLQQVGCTKEDAIESMNANLVLDIRHLLPKIRVPTLVIHSRGDRVVPIELGREIAGGIRGARFVSRDGAHILLDPEILKESEKTVMAFLLEDLQPPPAIAKPDSPRSRSPVTILFTDMESSTATTQRLGDDAAQTLVRAHNAIVRDALAAHEGSQVKHTGDGIMASFRSATQAVECAVAIQRALAARAAEDGEPIRVRIGLNSGEPVSEDDDLFGTAVQLAARVCARAEPGQIVASNVVR